ncbi:hypothetical protein, partial [Desulfotomaculum copahuensis]|uniref:hypothetical protein n=1 Tax=Desulfotomaculum copahuensis TaxID=1838280 RepID=UPI000AD402E1
LWVHYTALDGSFLFLLLLIAIAPVFTGHRVTNQRVVNQRIIKLDKLFSLIYRGENTWTLSVKVDLPFADQANPINELYKQTEKTLTKVNQMLAPDSTVKIRTWLVPRHNLLRLQDRYPLLASGKISSTTANPIEKFFTAYYAAKARKNKSSFMKTFVKTLNAPWSEISYTTPLGEEP